MIFNKHKRILVCGDRNWTDFEMIERILLWYQPSMIIEGGATGADSYARHVAQIHQIPYLEFRARWEDHGHAAGPIRNQHMIDEGQPDLVFAFHDDLTQSRGTKDMLRRAKKHKLLIQHFNHSNTTTTAGTLPL